MLKSSLTSVLNTLALDREVLNRGEPGDEEVLMGNGIEKRKMGKILDYL